MATDAQMYFQMGFNSVHKLACPLSSPSESRDSIEDWQYAVLERYWPEIGDSQVKAMAHRCVSTLYHGVREASMLLEHAAWPISHMGIKRYQDWLVKEEVQPLSG